MKESVSKIIKSAINANAKFLAYAKQNYIERADLSALLFFCLVEAGLAEESARKEAIDIIYSFLNESQFRQWAEKDTELSALKWRKSATESIAERY